MAIAPVTANAAAKIVTPVTASRQPGHVFATIVERRKRPELAGDFSAPTGRYLTSEHAVEVRLGARVLGKQLGYSSREDALAAARELTIGAQRGAVVVWGLYDPDRALHHSRFVIQEIYQGVSDDGSRAPVDLERRFRLESELPKFSFGTVDSEFSLERGVTGHGSAHWDIEALVDGDSVMARARFA